MMFGFDFADPEYFFILLLLIPAILWYVFKEKDSHSDLKYPSLRFFKLMSRPGNIWLRHLLAVLKLLAVVCIVLALARPQAENTWKSYSSEGIDIVLTMDVSGSMLAMDLKPDRLEASKEVAKNFILNRPQDRIGMVIFSGESFTQCPLTTDHAVLINMMKDIKSGMIEDGTAIGLGLANAVNRLKESKAKSKVVILLTDGINNRGAIAPQTAAELAQSMGVRVYTIGVGTYGDAPYPFHTPFGVKVQNVPVEIDEPMLKTIAEQTGGQYFRATDNEKLKLIYGEIDKLEKSKIEVKHFSKREEHYFIFALIGMLLLLSEAVLRYTLIRKLP